MSISVLPHIERMSEYVPPWSGIDRGQFVRLDLNESNFPIPSGVLSTMQSLASSTLLQRYPDYTTFLKDLAEFAATDHEGVMITNGSDQAIELVLRSFLAPQMRMAIAVPEFPMFGQITRTIGAQVVGVPFDAELRFPYDGFRDAISQGVDIAAIVNPNNPTGTPVELDYIESLVTEFPSTPFLIDEAYFEYTGNSVADLIRTRPNVIVTRTFSKAFAMAGLRLGYIIAQPELIRQFKKVRGPFDVNAVAVEVARENMKQKDYFLDQVRNLKTNKQTVVSFLSDQKVRFFEGAANFSLIELPERDKAVEYLRNNGILVRPMTAKLIENTFRVSYGTEKEMALFMEVFGSFLKLA